LPVLTGSMAPLIGSGDRVLVGKVAAEQVRFGDIVVFRRKGDLIVHRVFRKHRTANGLRFSEKGDTRFAFAPVGGEQIVGRVTMVEKRGRMLSLTSPLSRFTNLALSAWLYWTAAGITMLRSSRSKTIRGVGKVLSGLSLLSSKILVRICFAIWYPLGLLARENREPN
jgi:signal peptidase I